MYHFIAYFAIFLLHPRVWLVDFNAMEEERVVTLLLLNLLKKMMGKEFIQTRIRNFAEYLINMCYEVNPN